MDRLSFSYLQIKEQEFYSSALNMVNAIQQGIKKVQIDTNTVLYATQDGSNILTLIFNIEFTVESEEKDKQLLTSIALEHIFNVAELENNIRDLKDKKIPDYVEILASIAYSSTRGYLTARNYGSPIQSYLLPVVEPSALVKGLNLNSSLSESIS